MTHRGKRIFITGIPTSGKSYLAEKLAKEVNGISVSIDDLREVLAKDPKYKKWVNFYLDKNEETYLTQTSAEDKWNNLVAQSEALWPALLEQIGRWKSEPSPVIFESVNILPHLVKRDLAFRGVVLLGCSFQEIFGRNKKNPRWGDSERLQELEARTFFEVERPKYKAEALKYGYPVFETAHEAYPIALSLLR